MSDIPDYTSSLMASMLGPTEGSAAEDSAATTTNTDDNQTTTEQGGEEDETSEAQASDDTTEQGDENGEAASEDTETETKATSPAAEQLVATFGEDGVTVLAAMFDPAEARTIVPAVLKHIVESTGIDLAELVGISPEPVEWADMDERQRAAFIEQRVKSEVDKRTKPMQDEISAARQERENTQWARENLSRVKNALKADGVDGWDLSHKRLLEVIRENPGATKSMSAVKAAIMAKHGIEILKLVRAASTQERTPGPEAMTSAAPGMQTRTDSIGDLGVAIAQESAAKRARG